MLGQTYNLVGMVNMISASFLNAFFHKCVVNSGQTIMCNTQGLLCIASVIISIDVFIAAVGGTINNFLHLYLE